MGITTIRKIPALTGKNAVEFIKKAENPVNRTVTPQEMAIYKALIEKKKLTNQK